MKTLIVLLISFVLNITLSESAVAQNFCARLFPSERSQLSNFGIQLDSYEKMKPRIKSFSEKNLLVESFLGRSISFEEAAGFIASKLPISQQEQFIEKISHSFANIKIKASHEIDVREIHFKYKNRFMNVQVERYKTATIIWSLKQIKTLDQFNIIIDSTINLIAESSFLPIRSTSVLIRKTSDFTTHNVESVKDKILLQLYTIGTNTVVEKNGTTNSLFLQLRNILSALLPFQFREIRQARLTQEYLDLYREQGPQALYKKLRIHYGIGLSIKYWFTQLTNANLALIIIYGAFMTPQILQTYQFIINEQSLAIQNDEDYETIKTLMYALKTPPEDLLIAIKNHLKNLPPEEEIYLSNYINKVMEIDPTDDP